MTELDFQFFDCDNHYYEALDAFTRHIEPEYRKRAIQWAQLDGKQRLLVGGKVNRFIPNPTFDPVAKPGAMDEYFRGRNPKSADMNQLFGELEPIPAAYRDRDARLALMDEQGMHGCILLPTLGVGMEQALLHDLDAWRRRFAPSIGGWTRTGDLPTGNAFLPLPTSRCAIRRTPSGNSNGPWSVMHVSSS